MSLLSKYENLVYEASKKGIKIKELNLETTKPCGKCIGNIIVVNNQVSEDEKYCVLAEELGHYHLTVSDITDQTKVSNKKQELIARKWGYEKIVGILDLINAYKYGVLNIQELSDYLGVTEKFLKSALTYYCTKYGNKYAIDNYIINFIPFGIGQAFN